MFFSVGYDEKLLLRIFRGKKKERDARARIFRFCIVVASRVIALWNALTAGVAGMHTCIPGEALSP